MTSFLLLLNYYALNIHLCTFYFNKILIHRIMPAYLRKSIRGTLAKDAILWCRAFAKGVYLMRVVTELPITSQEFDIFRNHESNMFNSIKATKARK